MKTGLRKGVLQSVIPSINKLQHAVSQRVIPYCPFPAFPSWSPPTPFFPHPKSRTQGLEEGPICIDTGCWPRKPPFLGPGIVTRVEHLPFLPRLTTSEEPRGQGTYMTYAPIKLPTNFQNSPTGIKHLQPAEGSVRKFRLPQCSIHPTSTCPISVCPNAQTWTKHKQINNTHSDSTNTLLRRIHGMDFDFLRTAG